MTEQQRYQVRFDWGVPGAEAVADDADVLVWLDALDADAGAPRGAPGRPGGRRRPASPAPWRRRTGSSRCRSACSGAPWSRSIAAGAPRGAGVRFAAEDLLAAGAVTDALESRGIDAMSPEAAVADAAYRTLARAVASLLAAVAHPGTPNPAGPVVARAHREAG